MRRTAEQRGFSNRHLKRQYLTKYRTEQNRTERKQRRTTKNENQNMDRKGKYVGGA